MPGFLSTYKAIQGIIILQSLEKIRKHQNRHPTSVLWFGRLRKLSLIMLFIDPFSLFFYLFSMLDNDLVYYVTMLHLSTVVLCIHVIAFVIFNGGLRYIQFPKKSLEMPKPSTPRRSSATQYVDQDTARLASVSVTESPTIQMNPTN